MSESAAHLTITIEEIPELRDKIDRLTEALETFNSFRGLTHEWYTEDEVCRLKNLPYHTLRQNPNRRYLPNYGRRTEVLRSGRGRWMYPREQVAAWLPLTADQIDAQWEQEARGERYAG